jgi:CDP-glycerol glycerophosphotransferase (TagB/SpsB family)
MEKRIVGANYQENPNNNSKIGFVVFYPFQFYVFKNIYSHLIKDAEFIVDLGAFFPIEQPEHLIHDIIALLQEKKVFFRILFFEKYYYEKEIQDFFSRYQILISLWNRGCITLKNNETKRKVTMPYGAGKELTTFGLWKRKFDLVLAYGQRDSQIYSQITNSKVIGNPKFDDWFNNKLDDEFAQSIQNKLVAGKKTILYLPTHGDLSSIDDLAGPLKKLSSSYNVIAKLHYYNIHEEPKRVKKLDDKGIIILKDNADLLPLLKLSDVVLSDNSSVIFDAILADKPIVAIDFISKEYLDNMKHVQYLRRGFSYPLTYSNSIEQRIKRNGTIISVKNINELEATIATAILDSSNLREARLRVRKEIFAFNDGKCGERAAKAILDTMNVESLPQKPLLYYLIEVFKNKILSRKELLLSKLTTLGEYQDYILNHIKKENFKKTYFSVLVLKEEGSSEKNLRVLLNSLFSQKYPTDDYEIIMVGANENNYVQKIADEIISTLKRAPRIIYLENGKGQSIFQQIFEALSKAKGGVICFTKTNCSMKSDWLMRYHMAYSQNPAAGGIGGEIISAKANSNIYDSCEYYIDSLKNDSDSWRKKDFNNNIFRLANYSYHEQLVGRFTNMTYKKSLLVNAMNNNKVDLLELLELEIKKEVTSESKLQLISSPVYISRKRNLRTFCRDNLNKSLVSYIFVKRNPEFKRLNGYNLLSPLKFFIISYLETGFKIRFSIIVFLGVFYRWLGNLYGFSISAIRKDHFEKL